MTNTNIVPTENNEISIIDLDITDTALLELKKLHIAKPVNNNKELAITQKSITEITSYRTKVEKKRKELKANALEFGRRIDAEARRITNILQEIEQPFIDAKKTYNDEQDRIKAESVRVEKIRIDGIMDRITSILKIPINTAFGSSDDIKDAHAKLMDEIVLGDGFDYQEFKAQAVSARKEVLEKLSAMEVSFKIEEEKQASDVIRKQEEEAERIKFKVAQEKLHKEQKEFEENKREAEKQDKERIDAIQKAKEEVEYAQKLKDLEKQKEENVRLAKIEEERLDIERKKFELDKRDIEQKHRQESLMVKAAAQTKEMSHDDILGYFYTIYDLADDVIDFLKKPIPDEIISSLESIKSLSSDAVEKIII